MEKKWQVLAYSFCCILFCLPCCISIIFILHGTKSVEVTVFSEDGKITVIITTQNS